VTTPEVRELFAYNAWANRRFFATLEALPAEWYFRDLKSSHGAPPPGTGLITFYRERRAAIT